VHEPTRLRKALKLEKFAVVTSKLEAAIGGGGRRPFMIITQLNYGSAPALRNCTFMSSAHLGLHVLIIVVGSPLG
jgi:hypothetical protein